jgi:uncharacterized protein
MTGSFLSDAPSSAPLYEAPENGLPIGDRASLHLHLIATMTRYLVLGLVMWAGAMSAQQTDSQLAAYIDSIQAIDNHAHVIAPDVANDKGHDALRCDELPPGDGNGPANFRFGALTQLAWRALYGVEPATADEADKQHPQMLAKLQKEHGPEYFDWLLQKAGVERVLANRVTMTPALHAPHFLWVPYDDALLFPLNNDALKEANPDRRALFTMEEQVRQKYFDDAGVKRLPATLDEYLENVVRPTLARQKEAGAVAIKFEAAYLRALDFAPAARDTAAAVYRGSGAGRPPTAADYKTLQDFLFHEVAAEAGKLGMPVHIHTGSGCGQFFNDPGSDPMLLVSAFNDPSLRSTDFVMLHGGTPFNRHVITLLVKPNVFVDTSLLEFWFSPAELAQIMRPWLETMPEHILYGSDADAMGPGIAWQEATWEATHNFRKALTLVLTEMVSDGTITMPRAKEIAERVLRRNAVELYRLR